ncbi:MAG TPA: addiction module protein [Mucilaginibacter sp.]|jgi:putative addiction module component (TIGR02574 family)|nr:addiction module protein [Mucilaginibacter sp.]
MTTAAIREKLHDLIDTADDKHVKAVYAIFEDEIAEKDDPWEDEAFVEEIDQRLKDFESGKVKGIPWEEVKLKAENRLKAKQ